MVATVATSARTLSRTFRGQPEQELEVGTGEGELQVRSEAMAGTLEGRTRLPKER